MSLPRLLYWNLVERALAEDLGQAGDLTTDLIFDAEHRSHFVFRAREEGVLAGLEPALAAFTILDPEVALTRHIPDGTALLPGTLIATVSGRTRALLTGERTALNLLSHLSGVASRTRRLVDAVSHTRASIADTRKTLPGLRALQKYAVRVGGGRNHRFGLGDCVLIKDNHIAVCGSLSAAVKRVRASLGHTVKIEVEVDTLEQLREALDLGPEIIMLDNFGLDDLRRAVTLRGVLPTLLETSGRVTEETVVAIAETGVDLISVGALTHSVRVLDIGLDAD